MWLDMWTAATWIPRVLDAVGCSPSSPFYSTSALFLENSLYAADVDASPSMLNVFRLLFSAWRIKKRAESRVSSFTVRYENWWLLTCIWEVNFCQIKIICYVGFASSSTTSACSFARVAWGCISRANSLARQSRQALEALLWSFGNQLCFLHVMWHSQLHSVGLLMDRPFLMGITWANWV